MAEIAEKKLTPKQQAFVLEYPIDFNATQAAIRAGYSKKSARSQASRMLTKANVIVAIGKEFSRRGMSLDEALGRMAAMARGDIPYRLTQGEKEQLPQFEMGRATEILLKYHGALQEHIEHSGAVQVSFKVDYGDPDNPSKHSAAKPPLLPAPDTKQSGKKKGS